MRAIQHTHVLLSLPDLLVHIPPILLKREKGCLAFLPSDIARMPSMLLYPSQGTGLSNVHIQYITLHKGGSHFSVGKPWRNRAFFSPLFKERRRRRGGRSAMPYGKKGKEGRYGLPNLSCDKVPRLSKKEIVLPLSLFPFHFCVGKS